MEELYKEYTEWDVTNHFDEIVQDEMFIFYGVCGNEFKLGDIIFEAIEDPDDGYRSYLGSIVKKDSDGIFSEYPLGAVKVVKVGQGEYDGWSSFNGYQIIDVFTNHVWLTFGTDNYDDYYPCFVFSYMPYGG